MTPGVHKGTFSDLREEEIVVLDETQTSACAVAAENNRTAILLLDFQNEFVKKGGKLYDEVAETMNSTGVLQNVPKLVEFAR